MPLKFDLDLENKNVVHCGLLGDFHARLVLSEVIKYSVTVSGWAVLFLFSFLVWKLLVVVVCTLKKSIHRTTRMANCSESAAYWLEEQLKSTFIMFWYFLCWSGVLRVQHVACLSLPVPAPALLGPARDSQFSRALFSCFASQLPNGLPWDKTFLAISLRPKKYGWRSTGMLQVLWAFISVYGQSLPGQNFWVIISYKGTSYSNVKNSPFD